MPKKWKDSNFLAKLCFSSATAHSVAGLEPETVGADFIGAGAEPQKV